MTARALAAMAVLGVALAGCGSSSKSTSDTTIAGNADAGDVAVIKRWADELRAGDVISASERFALPSIVQNGTSAFRLTNRRQVEVFNQSLPCGARLTAASSSGKYTIATFVLTERPGEGVCGDGVGEHAKTAFVIQNGLIAQWRRVVDIGSSPSQGPVI